MQNPQHLRPAAVAVAAFLLAASRSLAAGPVALATTNISTVTATATDTTPSNTGYGILSLPYTTPASASKGGESATATPDFTTTGFSIAFSENAVDSGSSDDASADLFFVPGANVQYTLSGSATTNTATGTIGAGLYDQTTNTTVYGQSADGGTALSLNTGGGPLTGPLTAGDLYEFEPSASVDGPAIPSVSASTAETPFAATQFTISATVDLSFTQIPEPASATLLFAAIAVVSTIRRRNV